MVVAWSVFSDSLSGLLSQKSPGPWRIAFTLLSTTVLVYLAMSAQAKAAPYTQLQTEAANSFVFDRPNQNDVPLALKLSPFTPAPNEYKRFEEMSKDDRRLALGQIAVGVLAQTLDNRVGRAMLAITDPLQGTGGGVSCKQRFSMKSYLLRCRLKF